MRCIVIEAREWPLGFGSNAVLTPEYSCTDIALIEPHYIYDFEHSRCLCVCVCVDWRKRRKTKEKGVRGGLCACMSLSTRRKSSPPCRGVLRAHSRGPNTWRCIDVSQLGQYVKMTFPQWAHKGLQVRKWTWQIREVTLLSASTSTHIHQQPSHRALCVSRHSPESIVEWGAMPYLCCTGKSFRLCASKGP